MLYSREELKKMQEQVIEKGRLETRLPKLYERKEELKKRLEVLEREKGAEQKDVERLEGHSLAALFYHVAGNLDEKLEKERKEAYEAKAKYDMVKYELAELTEDISRCESALYQLGSCEQAYEKALTTNAEQIKTSGSPAAESLLKTDEKLWELERQKKELSEALAAGTSARCIAEKVSSGLCDAESWGTWDMLGGGFLSDAAKYHHLDATQEQLQNLQCALRRFKTELMDTSVDADLNVSCDSFTRFADVFFDNIFADWAVRDGIRRSQKQVEQTQEQINLLMNRLAEKNRETLNEIANQEARRAELILQFDH
ncbi:MAG: hypothetical protein ACLT46_14690 [Hungatella sp.]